MIARLASRFGRIVVAHPIAVLAATLGVLALAIVPASRLTIRSDVLALLPREAPASSAYRTFLESFGGIENVYVLLHREDGAPPDPEGLADAAEIFAREVSRSPEVAHARWGLDEDDEAFFIEVLAPRLPLLLGDDPSAVLSPRLSAEALDARARELRDAAAGPGALFLTRLTASDPLGLASSKLSELAAGGSLPFDPLTGALLSADGRSALVIVTPRRGESDAAGGRALAAALDQALASARADGGTLGMEAVGGPLYAAHDETALRADLIRILTTASILVLLLIVLAFGGVAIPAISLVTVAAGQVVCAALVALGYGPVTAVGVGFAAILLGLGDDFTLHLGARARAAWRGGAAPDVAVVGALAETAPGILAAGVTTAAAFACLAFAHFRPLRELGLVVALGMLLLLAATALVAAPLLVLVARRWGRGRARDEAGRGYAAIVEAALRASERRPKAVLLAATIATIAASAGVARLHVDPDLRRMRPEDHPALSAERRLVASFAVPLDTATFLVKGKDAEDALDRADAVASILRERLPHDAQIVAPSDWIVTGKRAERRLARLRPLSLDRAADDLARALDREGLRPEAFARSLDAMRAIGAGHDPAPIPLDSYPAWLREGLRVMPEGALAAVRARVPEGAWASGPPSDLVKQIESVAPGTGVASAGGLGSELRALAFSDLRRLGTLAVLVVFVLVVLSYRGDVRSALLTFVPVGLGVAWTAGLWGWLGRPLDLFTLCVLPVMVGIGIDDGLHILHLARASGRDVAEAAREAGRGVVLTNLTTSAGFAALAVSHVPALRNGGLVVCVGNLLCLAATLFVLPALAARTARR
ncbi:MAG TPA: MMPL family transporter [Candidatus Polarisedimenticolaceae bacterium]|nr:MMPL family transporter [Candidatus Polarisedimenticolaceae bacterium]